MIGRPLGLLIGMAALATVARRQRGVLLGGDQGKALQGDGEHALRAAGVVAPERMARLLAPGIAPGR